MFTRRNLLIAILLTVGGVVAFLLAPEKPVEPVYDGKPLSIWLGGVSVPDDYAERMNAIQAIGTNAIPFLIEMIAAHDPPIWLRKIEDRVRRERRPWSEDLNENGVEGFRILNTNAVSAVPALVEICERNYSVSSVRSAINALADIREGAQPALPMLVRYFSHKDYMVRSEALAAIVTIGGKPDLVIPAAARALGDTNINVRWNALAALSVYGAKARAVVPEILKLRDDTGTVGREPFRKVVELALWHIAPETGGKPLAIEMPLSFWRDGETTEAVKADLFGKRKVLIPKGARLPVVAQYWNSDPRPQITLYRGEDASDANDALIGKFEVLAGPEKNDPNVSTLCIITNGNAFISARDNHTETFLEIRRLPDRPE